MDARQKDLLHLKSYIEEKDKELTMILQSLQWDRKHLIEGGSLVACKYDTGHKVPLATKESHEEMCFLKTQGYSEDDILLPDAPDPDAPTLVKLSKQHITQIIDNAAQYDPLFKKGCGDYQPLSAARLQEVYTPDERRAIHDAVVSAAPDFEHVDDLSLQSTSGEPSKRRKSKLEVLAELRNMRRRRTRYRGTATSSNYSHVLRDLIKTQMETYTGEQQEDEYNNKAKLHSTNNENYKHYSKFTDNTSHISNNNSRKNFKETEREIEKTKEKSNSADRRQHENRKFRKDRDSKSHSRQEDYRREKHKSHSEDSRDDRHNSKAYRRRDERRERDMEQEYSEGHRRRKTYDGHEERHTKRENSPSRSKKRHRERRDDTDDHSDTKYRRYYDTGRHHQLSSDGKR